MNTRAVKDLKKGLRIFFLTFSTGVVASLVLLIMLSPNFKGMTDNWYYFSFFLILVSSLVLAIKGFIVNYTPLNIKNGVIEIPAADQLRTFSDCMIMNPITGLFRTRKYNVSDVELVANGYVRSGGGGNRTWNVVITGVEDGRSFSQKIDVSNKQVRDEVRNALKQTTRGTVNQELSM